MSIHTDNNKPETTTNPEPPVQVQQTQIPPQQQQQYRQEPQFDQQQYQYYQQQQYAQQQRPPVQEQPQMTNTPWSFSSTSLFGAPIARGLGSEALTKISTALIDVYKLADPTVQVSILNLDRVNESELAFSCIVVCVRLKQYPDLGVAYHVLVIEDTGDKIAPQYVNENGMQIEIIKVTGDAVDGILLNLVRERVTNAFPNMQCYFVDSCVVPRGFNVEDKNHIHKLALNAGMAAQTELETRRPGFQDINLTGVEKDKDLVVKAVFSNSQLEDAVGNPVRASLTLDLVNQKNNHHGRNQSVNSGLREIPISKLSGFIDLVWAPVNAGGFNPYQPIQNVNTQKYVARLVVTDLISNFSFTPASILLSLYTAMAIRDDNNWIQAFRPTPNAHNEIDLNDIGALNIEANLLNEPTPYGQRIDTKSDTFKLEDLGKLISSLVQPGLIVSMDVPESGPQTWYLSLFSSAALGSQSAYERIYNAAMQLTNGVFGKYFPVNTPMFTDINNRVHNGIWYDRNGMRRDLREFGYVAVANFIGERDPNFIRDWSDTWVSSRKPLHHRMNDRRRMIYGLTNETAEFTGFSQRVTFTHAFMDGLAMACREIGLQVKVITPLSTSDFNNQRGVADFVNNARMQPGQNVFNTAGSYYQNQPQWNNFRQY